MTETNGNAAPFLGQLKTDSVADCIGATPLVRLNRLPKSLGIKAQVYGKLEYFNAGGLVKDRIARRMVYKAEMDGKIKPGDTLIEASSGNTGIAIAMMAAVKGYKCIITLSEKMSLEKEQILKALGATVTEIPNSFILNQYTNPENPAAYEFGTAEELWHQTEGQVDVVISGAGTGGTVTGIARGLKKHSKDILIVAADPLGSILAQPGDLNDVKAEYKVEGIGYDFVLEVLDQSKPDLWIKTPDRDSFQYARRLVREEGLLCGGSSGATVAALV
ncbi:Tryptophan synthase beta subunit-like PLP-dependent enzymes superfamily [Penicillium griseofulvum]|uniref:cystathionine beta-synthase n=1 Tax=Penicillium patulum TaxID=5078 RepID=A0A135LST5_PENPA|nr:Tryptophan synthase beta subunit-like PLP-dependent enzymes superfamily [Penicillium griseofulvum]KXG52038.1 Tryptophan synthase beta subunit-like PLP-dependent enzymes superfamily [Penicillium griseofulvum]